MKPIYLKMRAFGPYADEQEIDFKALSQQGLFLIHGKTGSGKTAILDAITFALYGKSSGGERKDMESMRCQLSPPDAKTLAEFTFEEDGGVYTFLCGLRPVKKRSGETEYTVVRAAYVKNGDGVNEPLFENPKAALVNAEAARLIKLEYDQFRRIILLPQGQFEKLLTADSKEREPILSTLFGAEKWDRTAEYLGAEVKKHRDSLSQLAARISGICGMYGCETDAELSEKLERGKEEKTKAQNALTECEKRSSDADKRYDAQKTLYDAYQNRKKLSEELIQLEKEKERIGELRERLSRASCAEAARPAYELFKSAEENVKKRTSEREKAQKAFGEDEEKAQKARERLCALSGSAVKIAENEKAAVRLENMRADYIRLEDAAERLAVCTEDKSAAQRRFDAAQREYEAASEEKNALMREQVELYERYARLFRESGAAGYLAAGLEDGKPCPVCGSCTHPRKADAGDASADGGLIQTQAEIDGITGRVRDASEKERAAYAALEPLKAESERLRAEYGLAAAEYEALQKTSDTEYKTLGELDEGISRLKQRTEELRGELKNAEDGVRAAENSLAGADAALNACINELEKAKTELDQRQKELDASLAEQGFSSASELAECITDSAGLHCMKEEILSYDAEVSGIKKSIDMIKDAPEEPPDIEKAFSERESAREEKEACASELAVLNGDIEKEERSLSELSELMKEQHEKSAYLAKISSFAEAVSGSKGISLKRYVMGIMLSSVTAEANKLLEGVHGGRYRLYRKTETGGRGRKLGLDFEVYDSYSGMRRDVATLSGGEKFLASLSLSIGLSAVTQMQSCGIRADAMFIDEGFGTLDEGSVADALGILAHIRRKNSVIGIISHIPALRDNIPARVEVEKGGHGSSIKMRL